MSSWRDSLPLDIPSGIYAFHGEYAAKWITEYYFSLELHAPSESTCILQHSYTIKPHHTPSFFFTTPSLQFLQLCFIFHTSQWLRLRVLLEAPCMESQEESKHL